MNTSFAGGSLVRLVAGAFLGAVVGYVVFRWLLGFGLYALVLPGAVTGYGAAKLSVHRSLAAAVFVGLTGLVVAVIAEWSMSPFLADGSLLFFVQNLHLLTPPTLIMLAIGTFFAFWSVK